MRKREGRCALIPHPQPFLDLLFVLPGHWFCRPRRTPFILQGPKPARRCGDSRERRC